MPVHPARAAIWARVSTDRQETDNQVRQLQELAQRRGLEVVDVYLVEASARKGKQRADLDRALAAGRAGAFDTLLVWALDRLTREGPLETLQLVDRFARAGVQVVSLQESWTEAAGELRDLMLAIVGWVARFESDRRSERVKAGMARARAEGRHVGRPARTKAVEQLPRFHQVAELVAAGQLTTAEGARKLRVRRADFALAMRASSPD